LIATCSFVSTFFPENRKRLHRNNFPITKVPRLGEEEREEEDEDERRSGSWFG
jgi:hypothetical protein